MAYEIVKPDFPFPAPYLASVGFDEAILAECCIKKGVVKKLDSRQAVTVEIDAVEYENVPVWIHTDCGARLAAIKGIELSDPADYFKDAALMFPLQGSTTFYDHYGSNYTSLEPQVFVIVQTIDEVKTVLGVIGIVQNINRAFPANESPFKTYRPCFLFAINRWDIFNSEPFETTWSLFDIITGEFAQIPSSGPALPMVEAKDLTDAQKTSLINPFLSESIHIKPTTLVTTSTKRIGTGMGNDILDYLNPGSCYSEEGVEDTTGWDVVEDPTGTFNGTPRCDIDTGYYTVVTGDTPTGESEVFIGYNPGFYGLHPDYGTPQWINYIEERVYNYGVLTIRLTGYGAGETTSYLEPDGGGYIQHVTNAENISLNASVAIADNDAVTASVFHHTFSWEAVSMTGYPPCTWSTAYYNNDGTSTPFYEFFFHFADNLFFNPIGYVLASPVYIVSETNNSSYAIAEIISVNEIDDPLDPHGNAVALSAVKYDEDKLFTGTLTDFPQAVSKSLQAMIMSQEAEMIATNNLPFIKIEIKGLYFVPFNIDIALLE